MCKSDGRTVGHHLLRTPVATMEKIPIRYVTKTIFHRNQSHKEVVKVIVKLRVYCDVTILIAQRIRHSCGRFRYCASLLNNKGGLTN